MCAHEKVCCARRQEVYSANKGRRPSRRERELHLFYIGMAFPLYEGTNIYGFLPLPTKQRLKSAAVGVL